MNTIQTFSWDSCLAQHFELEQGRETKEIVRFEFTCKGELGLTTRLVNRIVAGPAR